MLKSKDCINTFKRAENINLNFNQCTLSAYIYNMIYIEH